MPKIERTTSLPATARIAQTERPAAPAPSAPARAPAAAFTGQAPATRELIPAGQRVATSASPNALWGEQPKPVSMDREAFSKLSQAEQVETLKRCQQQRGELGRDIEQRVEQLDRRWKNSRLATRTEALREYHDHSEHLTPGRRHQLDGLVARSESAQRRINELRAKAAALPKTPEGKLEQQALRKEIARELNRARAEQSKVVKEATAVVDADGLKVDRLAVTEQVIDPNAPKPGTGQSLLEKVVHFFKLDSFFQWATTTFTSLLSMTSQFSESKREARAEERKQEQEHRVEDRVRSQREDNERIQAEATDRARAQLAYLTSSGAAKSSR